MVADRVLVDTNVLLSATAPARRLHSHALAVLDQWPQLGRRLCTSGQILREYMAVCTRSFERNGLALGIAETLENVRTIAGRMRLLEETAKVASELRELVGQTGVTGHRIHDANLIATAVVHRVGLIVTANVADFEPFGDRIEILSLAEAKPAGG